MKYFLLIFPFIAFYISCSKDKTSAPKEVSCNLENVKPKGGRTVGIDLLDLTESNNFANNLQLAEDLGIEFIALHVPWTLIESSPNNFEDPGSSLALLNQTANTANLKFSLTIKPIDLSGKTVPDDLATIRFNDPEMVSRFEALIDYIFTKVDPKILLNIKIGNEIDGYDTSSEPQSFWADYGEFLNGVTAHIHGIDSNIKVGFTARLVGLLQQPQLYNGLLNNVDILGVTYYPIGANFDVKDPEVVFDELSDLVAMYTTAPLYLEEIGYQTSSTNKSNEDMQAAFYCNIFKAWDTHSAQIVSANIVRLNDLSPDAAQESAENYNLSSEEFIEYLRTLGIRHFSGPGTNKKAFDVIRDNLSARGW